jgi:hypothetical protein
MWKLLSKAKSPPHSRSVTLDGQELTVISMLVDTAFGPENRMEVLDAAGRLVHVAQEAATVEQMLEWWQADCRLIDQHDASW